VDGAQASRRLLGISYAEIGRGVARHWQLPEAITAAIVDLPEQPIAVSAGTGDWLRACGLLAGGLALLPGLPPEHREAALGPLLDCFHPAFPVSRERALAMLRSAAGRLSDLAPLFGLCAEGSPYLADLADWAAEPARPAEPPVGAAPAVTEAGPPGARTWKRIVSDFRR
jgi:hypothetical protein